MVPGGARVTVPGDARVAGNGSLPGFFCFLVIEQKGEEKRILITKADETERNAICECKEVWNIIHDESKREGNPEMSQVLNRIRTAEIPQDVRQHVAKQAQKREVPVEVLQAATKSVLKYGDLYKRLAKK